MREQWDQNVYTTKYQRGWNRPCWHFLYVSHSPLNKPQLVTFSQPKTSIWARMPPRASVYIDSMRLTCAIRYRGNHSDVLADTAESLHKSSALCSRRGWLYGYSRNLARTCIKGKLDVQAGRRNNRFEAVTWSTRWTALFVERAGRPGGAPQVLAKMRKDAADADEDAASDAWQAAFNSTADMDSVAAAAPHAHTQDEIFAALLTQARHEIRRARLGFQQSSSEPENEEVRYGRAGEGGDVALTLFPFSKRGRGLDAHALCFRGPASAGVLVPWQEAYARNDQNLCCTAIYDRSRTALVWLENTP